MEAKSHDEIDLMAVLSKVGWKVRKNYWLFLSLTLIGFGVGLGTSFIVSKEYESQLIINSDILTFSYADRIITTLNELLKEENYEDVSKRLDLKKEEVQNLKSMSVELLLKNKGEQLPENEKNYLVIKARTLDTHVLPQLQQGLLQYFQNIDYVKIRVEQRKEYYKTLIFEVEKQIKSLEELKSNVYSGKFFEGSKGTINFDPTTVNTKIIELSKDRLEYKNRLQLVNSIEVVESFTPHYRPVTGKKTRSSALGALVGILVAISIVALKSLDKAMDRTELKES
jgi:hypothetical protein